MPSVQKTYSPIDDSLYVEREFATRADIDAALSAAGQAQSAWKRMALAERQSLCHRAIDAFVSHKDIIAEELSRQMGRPIRFAGGEVDGVEERARYMIDIAASALEPLRPGDKPGYDRWIRREPIGVVLVIAPWNYPYLTAINAVVPAVVAGNAVILKHSAQTPLCAERLYDAFAAAGLPEGVFQFLHMGHDDTEETIRSPGVDYVAFTGSVAGGGMVERAAAGRFIGVGLELGGKDPAYVRADADIDHAAATTVDGAYFNSGQSCCGIERIYVHKSVYDEYLEKAASLVREYRLGSPLDSETTMGPLVRATAADFVRQQIEEAVAGGAVAHIDAAAFPLDKAGSAYLAPQLLTGVNHDMRIMTEESFGPVVGVMPVGSDDEAIRLMNDSDFGLTASIFTRDIAAGVALGERIETGTLFLNRCDYLDPALAWTGTKDSGRGCSLSRLGYDSLTRPKSFHVRTTW